MIHELAAADFSKVLPLFEQGPVQYANRVIAGVAAGNSPGRIWVDDAAAPQTALLWDRSYNYYLAGQADNPAVNATLRALVTETLAPATLGTALAAFKLYYTPASWTAPAQDIFTAATLTPRDRVYCTFNAPRVADWRNRVPAGFAIRPIDAALLDDANLQYRDYVLEEIGWCWNSVAHFLRQGFGFAVLEGNVIRGWCTAEYCSPGHCGIGIEVQHEYNGRGLATLVAAAFVEHSVIAGLIPHWDSWADNGASLAVARKVGFQPALTYSIYRGQFTGPPTMEHS